MKVSLLQQSLDTHNQPTSKRIRSPSASRKVRLNSESKSLIVIKEESTTDWK